MSEQQLRDRLARKTPTGTPRPDVVAYLDRAGIKHYEEPDPSTWLQGEPEGGPQPPRQVSPAENAHMTRAVLEQPWWKLSFLVWKETHVFFRFTGDDRLREIVIKDIWAAP